MRKDTLHIQVQLLSFITIAHFIHHVQLYTFPALLILITIDIPLSYLEMGFLGSLPSLIMALTSPIIGFLGRRERTGFAIVLIGVLLFSISNFFFSFASDFWTLFIGNILLGFGCTTFHPIGLGYSANSFGEQNRGKAMAINHAAGVMGTATAPFATLGVAVFFLDWKQTYLLLGISSFVLMGILLIWMLIMNLIQEYRNLQVINEQQPIQEKPLVNKIDRNQINFKRWILIMLGIILAIHALRSGVYRLISYFTVTLLRDFYQVESFGAGVLTSFILLLGSGADIYGAYLSDKSGSLGRTKIIIISGIGTTLAILMLIFLTENFPDVWVILLGFAFFAICFYLAGGTLQALMSDLVPQKNRTFFYSIVFSLGLVVSSASPTIFGALLDLFHTPSYGYGFILLLIFGSIILGSILLKRLSSIIRNTNNHMSSSK